MADRTMYVGDTFPPLKFQVSDETGVLDLSGATALATEAVGTSHDFGSDGSTTAIQPPEVDADGVHDWNCKYTFAATDTASPDTYDVYVKVTWAAGEIETFGPVTLEVKPVA